MSSIDDAWALLKQIQLSPVEREFARHANPVREQSGLGTRGDAMVQSNLGLFDPSLALQSMNTDFTPQAIRVGQGAPTPRAPEIESEFITPYFTDGSGGYKLMGNPAGGGKPVVMSQLTGSEAKAGYLRDYPNTPVLTGLGGKTPAEFRRQGNYEKLMRAILSRGVGIQSTNRNMLSNPFHRKFAGKMGGLYNSKVSGESFSDHIDPDKKLGLSEAIEYYPPNVLGSDYQTITQVPTKNSETGNPEGGFGSLARYDFGALPFRPNTFDRRDRSVRGKDPTTEQTLLAEAVLANMNRGRANPMSMEDLLFQGGRIRHGRSRSASSPMNREVFTDAEFGRDGALRYAIGMNTPHTFMPTDEKTGDPLLYAQPGGQIAQRVDDDFHRREMEAIEARQQQQQMEEQERRDSLEALLPNAGDLSDPANAPMMAAIQELIRRQKTAVGGEDYDDGFENLGSLFR
jgi:hypothetical protein